MAIMDASGTVPDGSTEGWKDKKRYLWLIGLVIPSAFVAIYVLYALTGWSVLLWTGPILILGIVPAIDLVAGLDQDNPPDDVIEALENDKYYRWVVYMYLPLQYLGLIGVMMLVAGYNPVGEILNLTGGSDWVATNLGERFVQPWDLSVIDKIAVSISIGCVGGIGINTAHELGHKKESHERWLSKIALAQSAYGHFYIEHNRGHHVRVATQEDPASSRVGENFYQFWPRTVSGSLKSAWNLEKKRYARRGTHPFHIGNDVLNAWLMTAVLWGVLMAFLGIGILPYLLIQAVVGFSLLEVVNYMEHYGMLRKKVGPAGKERYERVDPSHSWNSNNIATNVLLYHLQRHSDHHANPTRRYQALRDYKESPVLPTGYAGMIVLAIVPAIWRKVMDPRVLAHFDGDISQANISPRKRDKVLAKYGKAIDPTPINAAPLRVDKSAHDQSANHGGRCPGCGYVYDEAVGAPREGFPAGTPWDQIPDTWCCPDCGVREKLDFVPVSKTGVA